MRCVSGRLLHVLEQQPEVLALVDLVGGRQAALGEVDVHRVDADRLLLAQVVERAVAGDAVQPRPHVDRAARRRSIALKAAANTSWSTSSASSREPSMWRQNASRRDW